jgi:hypothetical protein
MTTGNLNHLNLVPPLVEAGHVDELIQAGQTLHASWSPLNNSLAVFVASAVGSRFLIRGAMISFFCAKDPRQ